MAKQKHRDQLTILEAVDNLSSLAELDAQLTGEEEEGVDWGDSSHIAENQEKIKATFRVVHSYLTRIYEKEHNQLKKPDTQRGIQAMMVLAGEAAKKLDKYSLLFKGAHGGSVTEIKEYQDLQKFYLKKIMRRIHESFEDQAAWEAEWQIAPEGGLDAERRGLKDLETVRRDKEYELFYIKKEDGAPFFNRNVIRHIRLIGEFDEHVAEQVTGENPVYKFRYIKDRALQSSAKDILRQVNSQISEFYKEALKHRTRPLAVSLNKAVMALMLAANQRNLLQNTTGKNCSLYYRDFHLFLREAMRSEEYRRLLETSSDQLHGFNRALLQLPHALACYTFLCVAPAGEAASSIARLIETEGHSPAKERFHEPLGFWNSLLEDDEQIRALLKTYPSGPLLKALVAFQEGAAGHGFDPLVMGNFSSQLFTLTDNSRHITVVRMPSPTRQEYIKQVQITEEFQGFLRYLKGRHQKHLCINLQDRTSWQEHARSVALEEMHRNPEWEDQLIVVTLPKHTDFYLQHGPYHELNDASQFLQVFKEQLHSFEECGFYLPAEYRNKKFFTFVDSIMAKIHHFFFQDEKHLSRKNRLDFIEIFYQFLTLKLIEWTSPDTVSFTSKDGVDTGAAASASFFAFARLLTQEEPFSSAEKEQLWDLLFLPALTLRDREIEIQTFNRAISSLSHFHTELDTQRERALHALKEYYDQPFLGVDSQTSK